MEMELDAYFPQTIASAPFHPFMIVQEGKMGNSEMRPVDERFR